MKTSIRSIFVTVTVAFGTVTGVAWHAPVAAQAGSGATQSNVAGGVTGKATPRRSANIANQVSL